MSNWKKKEIKREIRIPLDLKPGYSMFYSPADDVMFNYPRTWIMSPAKEYGGVKFHDKPPPDNDMIFELTIMHCPPGLNWILMPLVNLMRDAAINTAKDAKRIGPVNKVKRDDFEMTWVEIHSIEAIQRRPMIQRSLLARTPDVQVLMTYSFWETDLEASLVVWDEIVRSLRLKEVSKQLAPRVTMN